MGQIRFSESYQVRIISKNNTGFTCRNFNTLKGVHIFIDEHIPYDGEFVQISKAVSSSGTILYNVNIDSKVLEV